VIIIGAGFSGLSAASFMRKNGWNVKLIEKNKTAGGRASQLIENGFTFDKGPSFYWMPEVFEKYFAQFGKHTSDYYKLIRLDPSYRIYWEKDHTDIPADFQALKKVFEDLEQGSGARLEKYLEGAAYKYDLGINNLVQKPGKSFTEFLNWQTISGAMKLQVFTSIKKHIAQYFKHPKLRRMMEFPVLFLGALPEDTPALYSLMNYADIKGGTWYPEGGMYAVVNGMYKLALELGIEFHFNESAKQINIEHGKVIGLSTDQGEYQADAIISTADYEFTESNLLPVQFRSYSDEYWTKRVMAPSCLLYYVGLNKKLKNPLHHNLFFDVPFDQHGNEIYKDPKWPSLPLFYVSIASKTDAAVAPEGCENLVFLIPVASGLEGDSTALRENYFNHIVKRMEAHTGESIIDAVIYNKSYSVSEFRTEYNSFKGNAYGLASTLKQTALFRPALQSKKVKNLFYAGQLTVPGPGVPPCLISGEVVVKQLIKQFT
jgi:phytoene desaturase